MHDPNEQHDESAPENSNTIGVASMIESGDLAEAQMILGSRTGVKAAGIIRPGIKVPLSSCSPAQKAKYEELLEAGATFDEIDKALMALGKSTKSCLRPSNADHFTVREQDFRNPADADRLMKQYADPDGKLRSFPVWFTKGELSLAIPHNFRGFGTGGFVKFSSFYQGSDLRCRYVPASVQNPGRDDYQERPCPGLTDPEECADYKAKRCRFGGLYRCNVPGVSGIGEVIIPTNSWYGLGEAVSNLRRVRDVFGRFHGLHEKKPFLRVAKVQVKVRHEGKAGTQWVITVEPTVDMLELQAANDPEEVAARARSAMAMLRGPAPAPAAPRSQPAPAAAGPAPASQEADGLAFLEESHQESLREAAAANASRGPAPGEVTPEVEAAIAALKGLCAHAKVNIPWEHVAAWIVHEWGVTVPEVATVEQLRAAYGAIRTKVTADREEFVAYVADCHREANAPAQGDLFDDDMPEWGGEEG
jgi:hypothetical protein